MNLQYLLLHLSQFLLNWVQMCCWVAKGLVKGMQVSRFSKVDCLAGLLSRNIALLEDKELATDLTCDRR